MSIAFNVSETCATQTAFLASPGNLTARIVVENALATTATRAGSLHAVFFPSIDAFTLQGMPEPAPAPDTSDELKAVQ